MGRNTKYKKKYAKQLIGTDKEPGLRVGGASIVELCQKWKITRNTYNAWVKDHEEFAEAHEMGKIDVAAWWHKKSRDAAVGNIKANAGVLIFSLKNVDPEEWQEKTISETIIPEKLEVIIRTFPVEPLAIEGECQEIEDGE